MARRLVRTERHPLLKWYFLVQPLAATGKVWDRITSMARRRHPIRYFLQETAPLHLWITRRRIRDAIWWVRYRTINRTNFLKIRGLSPGYHDYDYVLLYASFSILVDYAEIGLSSKNYSWHEEHAPKWLPPFLKARWPRTRHVEAALAHMDWEIEVSGINTPAAERAHEIKRLYLWWTVERAHRIEPYTDSRIWDGVDKRKKYEMFSGKSSNYMAAVNQASATKDFYTAQDQAMLTKLVEVRPYLWT
jgi:hypothetical protein